MLKIDFVNDIAYRDGMPSVGHIFPRIDATENVLTNKISAIYRFEPKDIADLWAIARNERFSWADAIVSARKKDAGVNAAVVAEVIQGFPRELFETVK